MTDAYIRCDCCNTPIGILRDGYLEMLQRHHGEKHLIRIRVAKEYPTPVSSPVDQTA